MNFFKKKKVVCPIDEETRIWMENALIWLINQFSEQKLLGIKTLLPNQEDFPVSFNDKKNVPFELLSIITAQMDIPLQRIKLEFYDEGLLELKGDAGFSLFSIQDEEQTYSAGQYMGKDSENNFLIAIERSQLNEPEKLIATLSHELGHVKLLGEERLKENDESLTDLITVFYGLGIFSANSAAKFYSDFQGWRYSKQGYLTQQEWGYALALYCYIRKEITPSWINYLTPNIKSDLLKSQDFILQNQDKVLV